MALVYTVCAKRDEAGSYARASQADSLKQTWDINFLVTVKDDTDPDYDLATVSPFDVAGAPGVPRVNETVYYRNGLVIPWLVCRTKQIRRDTQSLGVWHVQCRFDTGNANDTQEGNNSPIAPPVNLTDIAPRVESSLGEVQRVLYKDKSETEKVCLTPTQNMFDQPFVERLATLQLRITQYEASITYEQMMDRKLKVNEDTYRTKVRYSWLITEVEATEVTVQLDAGPTVAALVTYTLELSPLLYGWKDERALLDTHHYLNGKKIAYKDDELATYTLCKVNSVGVLIGDQTDPPEYDRWETYDTISFSSFLQV